MMGEERVTMTNKHGKKKSHLISSSVSNGGGGGIAGLLVFGGALAAVGFLAVASFATNKNKAKAKGAHDPLTTPKPKPQHLLLDEGCKSQDEHDHETAQGIRSLLQHSTTPTNDIGVDAASACCSSHGTSNMSISQINSSDLLPTQTLILEEKIDLDLKTHSEVESPTCFHHQEIVFSDDSHPESGASSNENGIEEQCLVSLFHNPGFLAQEVDQDEPQDSLKSIEKETEDDGNDEDDDDKDVVSESGEEDSSKATEGTSLNSNEEPVWPAELIEEAEQEFKGGIIDIQSEAQGTAKTNISASADYCDSHVSSDSDADGSDYDGNNGYMTVTPEATLNEKANFSVVLNHQPSASHSFELRTWIIPTLLLALLLLLVLLTHRTQQSFCVLDDGNSVIIS